MTSANQVIPSSLKTAFSILRDAVEEHAFPGAVAAVTHRGKVVALESVGRFTYDVSSNAGTPETIFDLASVTKVVATTTMAMILYERGELDLDAPLAAILPEFRGAAVREPADPRRSQISIRMLLAHSSGLPAYERLFERAHDRAELLQAACSVRLVTAPGTRAEYSDIGFILLGEALARVSGEDLDSFCRREIFGPLGMPRTAFRPPQSWREQIPPTEDDRRFRHRVVQGEVHDENAFVMGGVAGHAGVFASAADVATFAQAMLSRRFLRAQTIEFFTQRQPGTPRALGWDTPSSPSQSGRWFSPRSYGHLGYTGTSLWIDPEREVSITLLTNRTWPDRQSQLIKQVRPRFHDAVIEALGR